MLGRVEEALAEMRQAQKLNPLSIIIRTHLGLMFYWGRRCDEAIEQLRQTLVMQPAARRARRDTGALTVSRNVDILRWRG
jgi:Flp pilus assembly protein TadD